MTNTEDASSYGINRFTEEAKKMDIDLHVVLPHECDLIVTQEGKRSIRLHGNTVDKLPDCVIPRGIGQSYFGLAILRHLEQLGVFILNNNRAIRVAADKLATIQMLSRKNIPIPKTMLAKFPLNLELIKKEFVFPLVLKKITGSQGRGTMICDTENALSDVVDMIDPKSNIIFQECMKDSLGKDLRVIVVGGRVIGAMLRKAKPGSFKANYSIGGKVENADVTPEMEWLAIESTNTIGLELSGVDLLFDGSSFRICEVNATPGFKGFEEATKINVARQILEFVQIRLNMVSENSV